MREAQVASRCSSLFVDGYARMGKLAIRDLGRKVGLPTPTLRQRTDRLRWLSLDDAGRRRRLNRAERECVGDLLEVISDASADRSRHDFEAIDAQPVSVVPDRAIGNADCVREGLQLHSNGAMEMVAKPGEFAPLRDTETFKLRRTDLLCCGSWRGFGHRIRNH
jgi:hypothetical protein